MHWAHKETTAMQSKEQKKRAVLSTFATRGFGKESVRVEVTRGGYRELKRRLIAMRTEKRAA